MLDRKAKSLRAFPSLLLSLAALCLVAVTGLAQSTVTDGLASLTPTKRQSWVTNDILSELRDNHYREVQVNDSLSMKLFDRYLELLDPSKSFFLEEDVQRFRKYSTRLDDALRGGDLEPAFLMFNKLQERRLTRQEFLLERLDAGLDRIDFTRDESMMLDREEAPYAGSLEELRDLWRKQFKYDVLNEKLADKTDEQIEKSLRRRYDNQLLRTKQTNTKDVFLSFMNTVTAAYDPHTQYFPPHETENFNIRMSLSVHGIGALLQTDGEYTKVVRIIPGGPAEASGQIKAADRILAVGQGTDGDLEEVIGWRIDEVVTLIRGEKGSTVRLKILPAGENDESKTRMLALVRDKVKLEEQSASKEIVEVERGGKKFKVGVIELPTFYRDFQAAGQGSDFKSSTRDVYRLIRELKQEGIDGLVMDLRDNGGGSLSEAKDLTGLFLPVGAVVQIRSADGEVQVLFDNDNQVAYDGPLAVMVNRLSASASEIFAGAIQDYGRGIVVGGRTFGKGTVQNVRPLGLRGKEGQIKLTLAKFYRVTGASTQNRGISPDISFPDLYDEEEIGESALPEALAWDKITSVRHTKDDAVSSMLPSLARRHEQRSSVNPDFQAVQERLAYRREVRQRNSVSLNEKMRRKEKADSEARLLAIENTRRKALGLDPVESLDDLSDDEEREDPYLRSGAEILIDFLTLRA